MKVRQVPGSSISGQESASTYSRVSLVGFLLIHPDLIIFANYA